MPKVNGFDMIKEILKLKPKQLFIIMTFYDTDENLIQSMKEGAYSFLRQPLYIEVANRTCNEFSKSKIYNKKIK